MWDENIFGEQMGDDELGADEKGASKGIYEGPVEVPGEEAVFRTTGEGAIIRGSDRKAVRAMQQALIAAGCPVGAVDGIIGPRTRAGMACFVERYGQGGFAKRFPGFANQMTVPLGTRPSRPGPMAPAPAPGNGAMAPALPAMTTMSMMAGDWRIWAAAGGVALVGYLGYRAYKSEKRKEIFRNIMDY